MRIMLYHGIVTRLEIRASEKHEMKMVQGPAIRPYVPVQR